MANEIETSLVPGEQDKIDAAESERASPNFSKENTMANEIETSLVPGEQDKIDAAEAALAADPHASREVSVKVRLHQHNEYPKMVYLGKKSLTVSNDEEHDKAVAEGYGAFIPEAPKEE